MYPIFLNLVTFNQQSYLYIYNHLRFFSVNGAKVCVVIQTLPKPLSIHEFDIFIYCYKSFPCFGSVIYYFYHRNTVLSISWILLSRHNIELQMYRTVTICSFFQET